MPDADVDDVVDNGEILARSTFLPPRSGWRPDAVMPLGYRCRMGLFMKDVDDVREQLLAWKPSWSASEKDYEDSAYRHLNGCFPKDKFERQY